MTTFWTVWVIVVVLLLFATMYYVIGHFFKQRKTADFDRVVAEFDGIEERDGPVPKIVWISYWVGLVWAIGYFIYMPGLGGFPGIGNFQADDAVDPANFKLLDDLLDGLLGDLEPGAVIDLSTLAGNSSLVASGSRVFQNNCVVCHRQNAQGQRMFPDLTDNDWIYGSSDAQIWQSIAMGRTAAMPGWNNVLKEQEIDNIVDYIVSLNPNRMLFSGRADVSNGEQLYGVHCASCHGADTKGDQAIGAPDLADGVWLYGGGKAQIKHAIQYGLTGAMPAYQHRLARSELIAVATYVKQLAITASQPVANQAQLDKGLYLLRIGDCAACHTAPEGGELGAGGLGFHLPPMGTIHSTNISQDVQSGIGSYSYQEFYDVMKTGKGPHGYLYPAMPYTSYKYVTDEDIEAIWALLKSINPRDRKNIRNTGVFAFDFRLPLTFWSLFFLGDDTLDYGSGQSSEWQRGKYLVMGLGHCGECHTPRNLVQAMDWNRAFKGNLIEGWQAPDISATTLYRQGWTAQEMAQFLQTGESGQGIAFAGMAEVIANSTRYLTDEDALAMAIYLLEGDATLGNTLDPEATPIERPGLTIEAYADPVYETYVVACGACHGEQGGGREGVAPPLERNSIFSLDDSYNSIAVVLRGLAPNNTSLDTNNTAMVRFFEIGTDNEIAELVTFVRTYFGGQPQKVTAGKVEKIRRALDRGGFTPAFHKKITTPARPEPK